MEKVEFHGFGKIPRLTRECVITEKIDGTNGSIYIGEDGTFLVGSRTRWIGLSTDNHGFASWCLDNKEELMKLGPGHHFGEWWGMGIQRNYGLKEKRFSLFNTHKWIDSNIRPKCCHIVPILYTGMFDTNMIDMVLDKLKEHGSYAEEGFMKPEGIVIYHTAGNQLFKKTIENDEKPKGAINEN